MQNKGPSVVRQKSTLRQFGGRFLTGLQPRFPHFWLFFLMVRTKLKRGKDTVMPQKYMRINVLKRGQQSDGLSRELGATPSRSALLPVLYSPSVRPVFAV